jgi:hypothetical protein
MLRLPRAKEQYTCHQTNRYRKSNCHYQLPTHKDFVVLPTRAKSVE